MLKFKTCAAVCLLLGASGISFSSFALEQPLKMNCKLKRVKAYRQTYVLNNEGVQKYAQIYLIKNKSNAPVMLDHPTRRSGAQAGWSSVLDPNKWSALVVSQTGFKLSCMANKDSKFSPTDCQGVIEVCQPPGGVRMNANGSYWLIENQNWSDFKESLSNKKIQVA